MGYEEFLRYLLDQLQAAFAGTAQVSLRRQPRNNGIRADTIRILSEGDSVCPSISLAECWKRHQSGEAREAILQEILALCQRDPSGQAWDFSRALTYSHARPYLAPKLIHRERNQELLAQVPH